MRSIRFPFWQVFALVLLTACPMRAAIVADSVVDFSGTQGLNNWYYGYYPGALDPSTFILMGTYSPISRPDTWVVDDELPSPIYYTSLTADGGHPNGVDSSRDDVLHYSVRRWTAEVSGTITIEGNLSDIDTGFGANGVIGRIFADNLEVYTQTIPELSGVDYSLSVSVLAGATIDFVIDPNGTNDLFDSTRFTASISTGDDSTAVPEPTSMLLIGAGCLIAFRRSRRHAH